MDEIKGEITIAIMGGHGGLAMIEYARYMAAQGYKVNLVFTGTDSGGSTGELREFFNKREIEIPGLGDMRNFLSVFLEKDNPMIGALLNLRSLDLESNLLRARQILFDFNLHEGVQMNFESYYKTLMGDKDNVNEKHPIGNLILNYLYLNNLIDRFTQIIGIPEGLSFINFTNGGEIVAEDVYGETIYGEVSIDVLRRRINTQTLNVQGAEVSQDFLDAIKRSGLVVIPPGSLANQAGLIKALSSIPKEKREKIRIQRFANFAEERNELWLGGILEMVELKKLGYEVEIILSDMGFNGSLDDVRGKYDQEGKRLVGLARNLDGNIKPYEKVLEFLDDEVIRYRQFGCYISDEDLEILYGLDYKLKQVLHYEPIDGKNTIKHDGSEILKSLTDINPEKEELSTEYIQQFVAD